MGSGTVVAILLGGGGRGGVWVKGCTLSVIKRVSSADLMHSLVLSLMMLFCILEVAETRS